VSGGSLVRMRGAFDIVLDPAHLRNTLKIALVVGGVLTAINQFDVFLHGDATAATFVKTAVNFCVPFVTSNLGLLAGKRADGMSSHPRQRRS
jgi:hypothetical protein